MNEGMGVFKKRSDYSYSAVNVNQLAILTVNDIHSPVTLGARLL